MERTIAHEVADELSELRRHPAGDVRAEVSSPVEIAQRRKLDLLRLADETVEHQRDAVVLLDLGEAPPDPIAFGVDDLDPVRRGSLDAIAAIGLDRDDLLKAVDVELRRLTRPVVGRDLHVEVLPLRADRIAERAESDETAARRDEAVADKAAGRREHRRLRVPVAVHLAEVQHVVPGLAARAQQVGRNDVGVLDVPDRGAMLRHDADHRRRVRLVAGERPHPRSDLGRLAICAARHQSGDRRRVGAALVGVVREPTSHQQRAEVRVAEPELAEGLRVRLDLRRRIRGVADGDLLCKEHHVGSVRKGLDVELAVLAAEFH